MALTERRTPARLASRILSSKELPVWEALPVSDHAARTRFLAVRWAIKEAAYKAMYPSCNPTWKELTFHGLQPGLNGRKPTLEYHAHAISRSVGKIHVSVSHDGDYVFATVLVEKKSGAP